MTLNRRAFAGLAGGAAALGVAGAYAQFSSGRGTDAVTSIEVSAIPIRSLLPAESDRVRFGALTFRSGLVLSSRAPGFGGLSGLWRSADGRDLVGVTDNAAWLTARVDDLDGNLAGLSGAVMAPILGEDGRPLRHTPAYDAEGLAIHDGAAYVCFERVHEVRRFAWSRDGFQARGVRLSVPPEVKRLPANESLEALAVAPRDHPLAGSIVTIAERSEAGDASPTRGWVLPPDGAPSSFEVARSNAFDITGLAFLPSGEALLLERRFNLATGVACRIRRLGRDAFSGAAPADGPILFEVDRTAEIDNMEGIAIHRDQATGATIVTLVSDDNFSPIQRTLLLEFSLEG